MVKCFGGHHKQLNDCVEVQIGGIEGPSSTRPLLENQSVQIQASIVLRGTGCWVRAVASGSLS